MPSAGPCPCEPRLETVTHLGKGCRSFSPEQQARKSPRHVGGQGLVRGRCSQGQVMHERVVCHMMTCYLLVTCRHITRRLETVEGVDWTPDKGDARTEKCETDIRAEDTQK